MRGDRPWTGSVVIIDPWFTPHARGSTAAIPFSVPWYDVYPARIDPALHAALEVPEVYPACVTDLVRQSIYILALGLPRMRGSTCRQEHSRVPRLPCMRDRPHSRSLWYTNARFTLHARGSTRKEMPFRKP